MDSDVGLDTVVMRGLLTVGVEPKLRSATSLFFLKVACTCGKPYNHFHSFTTADISASVKPAGLRIKDTGRLVHHHISRKVVSTSRHPIPMSSVAVTDSSSCTVSLMTQPADVLLQYKSCCVLNRGLLLRPCGYSYIPIGTVSHAPPHTLDRPSTQAQRQRH